MFEPHLYFRIPPIARVHNVKNKSFARFSISNLSEKCQALSGHVLRYVLLAKNGYIYLNIKVS
jgi:hypothetical protein